MNAEIEPNVGDPGEAGTKDKILAAARTEFADFGLAGARVDRIAEHAGVNKAMIYYYYQSKENLHREVIRWHIDCIGQIITERIPGTNLTEMLSQVLAGHARLAQKSPEILRILGRELADPRDEFLDWVANLLTSTGLPSAIGTYLDKGIQNGEIRSLDRRQMAVTFISMSLGYLIMAPLIDRTLGVKDREQFIEDRKAIILDIFLNGVRPR